jgi:hypothetical protein
MSLPRFFADDRAEAKEQSHVSLCPITRLATALRSVSTVALSSVGKQLDCTMQWIGRLSNFLRFRMTLRMLKNSERRIPP